MEQELPAGLLQCGIKFHKFNAKIGDVTINFEIIMMQDSLYLWIGDYTNPTIEDLSISFILNTGTRPIVTKLMGSIENSTSSNMARRLSVKLGKPVYVSFNVTADNMLLLGIEKRIQEEFQMHKELL